MGTVECEDGRVRRTVLGEIVCKTTSRCEDGCARGRLRTRTVACEVGRARGWFAHKHEDGSRGPSDFADCRDSPVVPASRPYRSALSACAVSPKIPLLLPTLRESWVSVEGCVDSGWLVSVGRRCDARFANYRSTSAGTCLYTPKNEVNSTTTFPIRPILLSVFCSVPDIITKIVAMQYINFFF